QSFAKGLVGRELNREQSLLVTGVAVMGLAAAAALFLYSFFSQPVRAFREQREAPSAAPSVPISERQQSTPQILLGGPLSRSGLLARAYIAPMTADSPLNHLRVLVELSEEGSKKECISIGEGIEACTLPVAEVLDLAISDERLRSLFEQRYEMLQAAASPYKLQVSGRLIQRGLPPADYSLLSAEAREAPRIQMLVSALTLAPR
ncbi:MAG: hypothetical protein KDD44_08860, partial [Bdellovibrionales bacterium]|nr:hypothetical protein [Bdellovibrionales bacterium]